MIGLEGDIKQSAVLFAITFMMRILWPTVYTKHHYLHADTII